MSLVGISNPTFSGQVPAHTRLNDPLGKKNGQMLSDSFAIFFPLSNLMKNAAFLKSLFLKRVRKKKNRPAPIPNSRRKSLFSVGKSKEEKESPKRRKFFIQSFASFPLFTLARMLPMLTDCWVVVCAFQGRKMRSCGITNNRNQPGWGEKSDAIDSFRCFYF